MNIEGGKLASVLQAGGAADGRGQLLNETGHSPGGFAEALFGQMESLAEAKIQEELPSGQHKVLAGSQPANLRTGPTESLGVPGGQPFALPADGIEESDWAMNAEAMLVSLAESPKSEKVAEPLFPETGAQAIVPADGEGTARLSGGPRQLAQAKAFGDTGFESRPDAAVTPAVPLAPAEPAEGFRQKIGDPAKARAEAHGRAANSRPSETETENPAGDFAAMNAPAPLPVEDAVQVKPEEGDGGNSPANASRSPNAPQSFIQPLFEAFKSGSQGREASEGVSPQNFAFGQIVKEHRDLNENRAENSPLSETGAQAIVPADGEGTARLSGGPRQLAQAKAFGDTGFESRPDAAVTPAVPLAPAEPAEGFRQKIGDPAKARAEAHGRAANSRPSETETENPAGDFAAMNAPAPLPVEDAVQVKPEEGDGGNSPANASRSPNAPQSFIQPLFEAFKSGSQGREASEGVSPQNFAFGQIVKEHRDLNENRAENSPLSEGTGRGEAEPQIPEMGGKPFQEVADISQLKAQPVENRADIPAISKPLAHPDWKNELGERILWMNNKELHAAEIKLNPPHLGPISVRIEINDDQTTIAFTAQHAAVRDALEASIPKLREMMSNQQLNLADVSISQNSSSDQRHQSSSQQSPRNFDGFARMSGNAFEASEEAEERSIAVSKGILSIYA
jgi:hypothetical protein